MPSSTDRIALTSRGLLTSALVLPLAALACSSPEPAPQPSPSAPAVELTSGDVGGTPTAADASALPQPVYASHDELVDMYEGQITEENFDAFLDQIEAELAADLAVEEQAADTPD